MHDDLTVAGLGFPERLQALVDGVTAGNVVAYARRSAVSEPMLRRYLKGESEPGMIALIRLARAGGADLRWLATGEGHRNANDTSWAMPIVADDLQQLVRVPFYEAELSAGSGREPWPSGEEAETLRLPQRIVRGVFRARGDVIALPVHGDSMEPTIRDGAVAIIDVGVRRIDRDGSVFALRNGDVLLIKRVYPVPGGGLRLVGDNRDTPELSIGPEVEGQLQIIGRVVGVLNRP